MLFRRYIQNSEAPKESSSRKYAISATKRDFMDWCKKSLNRLIPPPPSHPLRPVIVLDVDKMSISKHASVINFLRCTSGAIHTTNTIIIVAESQDRARVICSTKRHGYGVKETLNIHAEAQISQKLLRAAQTLDANSKNTKVVT